MKPSEAAVILGAAAAIDNRIVTDVTAQEWARALDGLNLNECLEALRKFRRTTVGVYLEPGHIRERVRIARDEAHAKAAATRGLPTGPPARAETRAEARARVARAVAAAKLARQPTEATAPADGASVAQPETRTA